MPHATILVAEDFPAFREFTCGELRRRSDFHVVAVADGPAAVHAAEQLQPDLLVLDIGLPGLNGLEAARHIRAARPSSQIVFLTQETSPDIVHEAFDLGASGYVDKKRAHYLLPLAEAIVDRVRGGEAVSDGPGDAQRGHHLDCYSDESTLMDAAGRFLASAALAGDAILTIATARHRQPLLDRMKDWGADVDGAIEQGSFVHLDAADTASLIASDGAASCRPVLRRILESAAGATGRSQPRVAVFGEGSPLLCAAGHVDGAMGLEEIGNDFRRTLPIDILCGYPLGPLSPDTTFKRICAQHSAVAIR